MNADSYIDGFVVAVPTQGRDAYRQTASHAARVFQKHGAVSVVECWGDDVPEGKLTSFPLAVKCLPDETVVFSWIEWPDKATRDKGMAEVMNDADMPKDMPFDGKRMIFGGFSVLFSA